MNPGFARQNGVERQSLRTPALLNEFAQQTLIGAAQGFIVSPALDRPEPGDHFNPAPSIVRPLSRAATQPPRREAGR
jgi:hypothetical protein